MTKMLEEMMKLSSEERKELAEVLWDSAYDESPPYSVTESDEAAYYKKKVEEQAKSPEKMISWEEMKARILQKI